MELLLARRTSTGGGKRFRFTVRTAALITGIALFSPPAIVSAQQTAPSATVAQTAVTFRIPTQNLNAALIAFAESARLQMIYDVTLVDGLRNTALDGTYTAPQGLARLLAGTGLTFHFTGPNTVSLAKPGGNDPGAAVLGPIMVGGATPGRTVEGAYTTPRLSTATGLGISAQETPQSVTVVTSQRIKDQNMTSLTDVVKNTPGISSQAYDSSRDGYASRGFHVDNYQIDGIPIQWDAGWDAGETQSDTALYERVEVVRGATGLLTGAGNPSASINLVRKRADSKEFTGTGTVSAGRWNTYGGKADVSAPLTENGSIRGRAVAAYEEGDSFIDLLHNEKWVAYAVVDADITDHLTLSTGFSYQDNNPKGTLWGGLPIWFSDGSRTNWDRSKTIGADWTKWASTNETYFADLTYAFDNGWEAKLNLSHAENVGDLRLLYLSGQVNKTTGLGLSAFRGRYDTIRKQDNLGLGFSGEYQLLDREHELTFGATYSKQNHKAYTYSGGSAPAVGNFFAWDGSYPEASWGNRSLSIKETTNQTGFYAATRLSPTDKLKVILGGRVANWEKYGESYGSNVDYGDDAIPLPYAGVLYDVIENHTAYVSYTDIFLPQNQRDRTGAPLEPITGASYEAGFKSAFFGGALNTTASIFRIEQDNLAQEDAGHFVPGTATQAYYAAKGAVSEGFELEVVGEVLPGWNVSLSYTEFEAEDASGKEVNTRHPKELFKLFTTYDFPGEWKGLTIGGGVNWEGSNYTDTTNPVTSQPERLEQEAYAIVDLMARYAITDRLSAQLNVHNLFDKTYYSQIGFYTQLAYGEPLNVSLSLDYTW